MPTLKREHCVTDTTALLYDIAVTLEKILAAMAPTAATEARQPAAAKESTPRNPQSAASPATKTNSKR